jgi:ribosome-associated toxin RatA of RatAB toxin-antitoxin module
MYALVCDVESYPDFLPWCTGAEILSQDDAEICGRVEFAVGGVSRSFATRNRLVQDEEIGMQLLEGPFSQLHGRWRFEPLGDEGCKISLFLEYDFSSKVVGMVVGPVFNQIANSLVDAFQKRALEVYGSR